MNVSEYIASGILEVYILGELPTTEATEVEDMAATHSEIRKEISQIQKTFEVLANQLPVMPRATLKADILDQLAPVSSETNQPTESVADAAQRGAAQPDAAQRSAAHRSAAQRSAAQPTNIPSSTQSTAQPTPKASGKQRSLLPFQLGIAASILVALLSMAAALYFRSQWQETEQELSQLVAQNQEIASQYETASQRAERLEDDLSIVSSPDFQQVALAGTDSFPNSSAKVYWNQGSAQVYLNAGNLPAPPSDKQYQLWAIVDDQPVSAGLVNLEPGSDTSPLQAMRSDIANAAAFAITLEPRGGSKSPTLEAMYVLGNVADS